MTVQLPGPNAERVLSLRAKNPCATLQEVAAAVGVTRERVRQILLRAGEPTRHHVERALNVCMECGKPTQKEVFCGMDCRHNHAWPLVACDGCGVLFRKSASDINAQARARAAGKVIKMPDGATTVYKGRNFHSRQCFGAWLGRTVGFVAHPENGRLGRGRKSKYDAASLRQEFAGSGLPRRQFAKFKGIPVGTIYKLLAGAQA